jgi:uncharacterized membrane protein YccC
MIDIVIGVVIGIVFTASAYEIFMKQRLNRISQLLKKTDKMLQQIEDIKNKKGGE